MVVDMANGKTKFLSDLPAGTKSPVGWPESGKDWFWESDKRGDYYKVIDDSKKPEPPAAPPVAPTIVNNVPTGIALPSFTASRGGMKYGLGGIVNPPTSPTSDSVTDQMRALTNVINSTTVTVKEIQKKLDDTFTRTLVHDTQIAQTAMNERSNSTRITALEYETKALQDEIEILKSSRDNAEELARNLSEQNESLQEELEERENELTSIKKRGKDLKSKFPTSGSVTSGTLSGGQLSARDLSIIQQQLNPRSLLS